MAIQGHVENGHIVLDSPLRLPEGTKITVLVQSDDRESHSSVTFPSLFERLKSVAGKAKGLPSDLAINHDHYLHGQPKRQ